MGIEEELKQHREFLLNSAKKLLTNPSDAEDLVQETMIRAIKFQSKFDGRHLRSWLYKILRNLCINKYHKEVRETNHIQKLKNFNNHSDNYISAEDEIQTTSTIKTIECKILSLPDAYREVAHSIFIKGLTYQETADNLNLPIGTVMSKLFRARQLLKISLEELKLEYNLGEGDSNVPI